MPQKEALMSIKSLQRTSSPLRGLAAAELSRYTVYRKYISQEHTTI
jgi:hypothetical protein